jgi:hypothetical protein
MARVPRGRLLRAALAIAPLAGAALLVAAELSTLYEVRVGSSVPAGASSSAGAHHGYALLVIAVAAAVMTAGAVAGRSRPAAMALWLLGIAALGIALLADRPVTDDTGLYGRTYDAASAVAGPALTLELAGGAAILAGAALLLFVPGATRWGRPGPSPGRRAASAR